MCTVKRALTGFATGGLSEAGGITQAAKLGQKGLASDARDKTRKLEAGKAAIAAKKKKKTIKTSQIRKGQISKFNANVASGGAKRAANV